MADYLTVVSIVAHTNLSCSRTKREKLLHIWSWSKDFPRTATLMTSWTKSCPGNKPGSTRGPTSLHSSVQREGPSSVQETRREDGINTWSQPAKPAWCERFISFYPHARLGSLAMPLSSIELHLHGCPCMHGHPHVQEQSCIHTPTHWTPSTQPAKQEWFPFPPFPNCG